MQHFALTIIGRDRPGIVSQVTEILFQGGFNIADSSCSILGGQFSMILIISNPAISTKEEFSDTFKPLEENNLSVYIRTLKPGGEIRPELDHLNGFLFLDRISSLKTDLFRRIK